MTCAGACARLAAGGASVTLLSGEVVCTWCDAWRLECYDLEIAARAILRMIDKETRQEHLATLEARFGSEYRARLERVILEIWGRRRAAAQPATA